VALDTCAHVPWIRFERVLDFVDLVLLDLKLFDPERHRVATGSDNILVLQNARRLAASGVPLWIRTPIVPGFTDDDSNVQALGRFIRDELRQVQRWDLLAYTNLGSPKYRRLGLPVPQDGVQLLTEHQMQHIWKLARAYLRDVRWSGATRAQGERSLP
jgi:pyruvate formate lyase activating enzyme